MTDTTTTSREAFETWVTERWGRKPSLCTVPNFTDVYEDSHDRFAWAGWQAATERAARICEGMHILTTRSDCAAAIRGGGK